MTKAAGRPSGSWTARPVAARLVRIAAMLVPLAGGCLAALVVNAALPIADSTWPLVARTLLVAIIATLVVRLGDRAARRLLPLAALMQLSLVFPDHAPSRFRSALKAGSSRRLERAVADTRETGLPSDPGAAARQVVEMIGVLGDHDRRTRGHSERVRLYADLIGEELRLSKEERQKLQWGALLHDLGKLTVPGEILNKAGKPDADEWAILQGHPQAGMKLIEPLRDFLGEWVHAIGGHHEKWDGTGYPKGLRGREIPRAAAIVAVADSFEVMTAVRSYKKAMPIAEARAELTRCAGQHFSPEVVRAFLKISLGRVRISAGPLAAFAHLPFIGNALQVPAMIASAAPGALSTVAVPIAAASLTVPGVASAVEPMTVDTVPPPTSVVLPVEGGPTTTVTVRRSADRAEAAAMALEPVPVLDTTAPPATTIPAPESEPQATSAPVATSAPPTSHAPATTNAPPTAAVATTTTSTPGSGTNNGSGSDSDSGRHNGSGNGPGKGPGKGGGKGPG